MGKRRFSFGLVLSGFFIGVLLVFAVCATGVCGKAGPIEILKGWKSFRDARGQALEVPEDGITQYDSLLGWRHKENSMVSVDYYWPGSGIVFETNSQGFRSDVTYALQKDGKRVIALGDSFTYGITNLEDSWPRVLETRTGWEVINMGVSGYGVDQMYLWYKEYGMDFEADVVAVALIHNDAMRNYWSSWVTGHGKPRFVKGNDGLELTNVPVPKRIAPGDDNVRSRDFLYFLQRHFDTSEYKRNRGYDITFELLEMFDELTNLEGKKLVVVYLPEKVEMEYDYPGFRKGLANFLQSQSIEFLDLTDILRKENAAVDLWGYDEHYTPAGNRIVAKEIERFLDERFLK